MASQAATAISYRIARSRNINRLLRIRYQLLMGIVFAVLPSILIHRYVYNFSLGLPLYRNMLIGGTAPLLLGYMIYRRMQVFPGIASGGYILPSFSVSFGLLATVFVIFRIDYSRSQLILTYLLTVTFYMVVHLKLVAKRRTVLGVVPGGQIDRLPISRRVRWCRLPEAQAEVPGLQGVVADLSHTHDDAWQARIAAFVLAGVPVYDVRQSVEQLSGRVEIRRLSENMLGSLNPNDMYLQGKAVVDAVAALALIALLSPLLLIVAVAIRVDSAGPALFKQRRMGFRGQPFTVCKFRTMYVADEGEQAYAVTVDGDPRITRIGAILRRNRIDELPQLFNVLRGEMSLIGPRPEALALSADYQAQIPFYRYRHIIKPGITGWAQVNQGYAVGIPDVQEKLHFDFYYVKNFSFWLDLLITLRTIQTIFSGFGAR